MGVGGCLGSGAIQNHLVGFQLGTIHPHRPELYQQSLSHYQVEMGEIVSLLDLILLPLVNH